MTEVQSPPSVNLNSEPAGITLELAEVKMDDGKVDMPSPNTDSGVILDSGGSTPISDGELNEDKPTTPEPTMTTTTTTASPAKPRHVRGPDVVLPADSIYTVERDGVVKLRVESSGPQAETPMSVISVFRRTVKKYPQQTALATKVGGQWKKWTYTQYYNEVCQAAKAFIKLGLEPHCGVGIVGFNSPEWFISDLAAIFAGGFATGIYTTNSPEAVQYVADNAQCSVIVVENDAQLQKVLKVRDQLPHLKAIVQYSGKPKEAYPNTYTWAEFLAFGKETSDEALEDRIKAQAPNKCCTLIYTSGTTGKPKGVMLSHDNITWTANVAGQMARLRNGDESIISFLPLSHIAAQMLDIYMPLFYGGTCYFAQPDALKGSLLGTLKEVRPTMFFGVPRVWEKFQEGLIKMGKQNGGFKRKVAVWAKGVGIKGNMAMMNGSTSTPFGWGVANAMVFKKVRAGLGLDRCRNCLTGAAPITRETIDFFMSLNIPLMELYGMSENTGPHTLSFPWRWRVTSVGTEIPGATTKLDNPDAEGNGEICMAGRHVCMGYLNEEAKTLEAIDRDGWLHTGDVGRKDKDGYLFITGRIKELIITAGGENVAPVPVEDIVKEELPVVSNCMLIGDKRKFISILLTLKTEVDLDTMNPLDKLSPDALEWCQQRGSSATTVSQVLDSRDEHILRGIQEGIDRANARSVSRAQKIQKWSILPRDFSIPGDELGPTLKLKRPVVTQMYKNTIEAFYVE